MLVRVSNYLGKSDWNLFEWPNRLKVLCDLCSAGSISPSGFHFSIFLLVEPYLFLERDKNKVGVRGRSLTRLRYQLLFVTSRTTLIKVFFSLFLESGESYISVLLPP